MFLYCVVVVVGAYLGGVVVFWPPHEEYEDI